MNRIFVFLFSLILLSGCGPTYPKEKLTQALVDICRKEHKLTDVQAKLVGKTLGVKIALEEGLFDAEFKPTSKAFDIIGNVALAITRVCLSSNADIQFCVVVIADKRSSGFEWRFVRYIMDIKRVYLEDISRGEFFKRADFDLHFDPQALLKGAKNGFYLEDIKLTDFLARQMAKRVKNTLETNPYFLDKFNVNSLEGRFEMGVFKLVVDVTPKFPLATTLNAKAKDYMRDLAFGSISDTVRWYSFKDFSLAQLKFGKLGELMIMDKAALFRNYGRNRKKVVFAEVL